MVGTYWSTVVNSRSTTNNDKDIEHKTSHKDLYGVAKRRIALAVVASILVGVCLIASRNGTNYFPMFFDLPKPERNQENGSFCVKDKLGPLEGRQCKSRNCVRIALLVGMCMAEDGCFHDSDCDKFEMEDPDPNDDYLLPKLSCDKETNKCVIFKRDEPIGEDGYPVMLPNDDIMWIPREERDFGPLIEQVWHWRIDNQPKGTNIRVNGTHVFFPLYHHTVAGYARTYNTLNESESGIVSMSFGNNPISILSPRVIAGMGEKYHTLTYNDGDDDELDESNVEAARAEVANRTECQELDATEDRAKRDFNMASTLLTMGIADKLTEGCLDKAHVQQLRDLLWNTAPNDTAFSDMYASENREDHSAKAIQALRDVKTKSSLKTEHHCKHFESMPTTNN